MHRRLEALRPGVPCPIALQPGKAMLNVSSWPRKLTIAIGASWWTALFGLAFLAYFVSRPCADGICDGLGRHLTLTPDLARLILHTDRLWAGWRWMVIDMITVWVSAIIAYMLLESLTDDSEPSRPNLVSDYDLPPTRLIKPATLGAELQEMRGAIAEAAARASCRSDITLDPEEEGWSIRVNGEIALQVESSATGQKVLAYARSLIDMRKPTQSTHSVI
jgi:phage shock protein PspC (stress-responsive transcriptional regulator)